MPSTQEYLAQVGSLEWFCREVQPDRAEERPPVLLLHGLVSQSYSWQLIQTEMAAQGMRSLAPDWIGFGQSAKPEPHEFSYRPEGYLAALDDLLAELEVERMSLVAQGFLGCVGLLYALRHPDRIERLVIVNCPLTQAARLPWKIRQLGLPLAGEMFTQDPLLVDRVLEGGGKYPLQDAALDVYRRPYLKSSAAGRALLAAIRRMNLPTLTRQIETGFDGWAGPVLLAWGLADPWLPLTMAQTFAARIPRAEVAKLEPLGHYAQQDWPQKLAEVIIPYLRKLIV